MKTCGSGGIAPHSLISALDGGEWLTSRPSSFIPVEMVLGTHWMGGLVSPRFGQLGSIVSKDINLSEDTFSETQRRTIQ
jgi:hypothetical protein